MKGPKELKRYVAKYREHLKLCHWDDLKVFKLERCKKWYKRHLSKKVQEHEKE